MNSTYGESPVLPQKKIIHSKDVLRWNFTDCNNVVKSSAGVCEWGHLTLYCWDMNDQVCVITHRCVVIRGWPFPTEFLLKAPESAEWSSREESVSVGKSAAAGREAAGDFSLCLHSFWFIKSGSWIIDYPVGVLLWQNTGRDVKGFSQVFAETCWWPRKTGSLSEEV